MSNATYKVIGQHDNATDAMFAVLESLVGSAQSRQTTRKRFGCTFHVDSNEWSDTNIVHDMIKAYESAKTERQNNAGQSE